MEIITLGEARGCTWDQMAAIDALLDEGKPRANWKDSLQRKVWGNQTPKECNLVGVKYIPPQFVRANPPRPIMHSWVPPLPPAGIMGWCNSCDAVFTVRGGWTGKCMNCLADVSHSKVWNEDDYQAVFNWARNEKAKHLATVSALPDILRSQHSIQQCPHPIAV